MGLPIHFASPCINMLFNESFIIHMETVITNAGRNSSDSEKKILFWHQESKLWLQKK